MSPTELVLSALADRDCNPLPSGRGWVAKCPSHDDHRPSLSVSKGDDERVLVHCHKGCSADAICAALGLRIVDLMPPADSLPRPTKPTSGKPAANNKSHIVATYDYRDEFQELFFQVVRYEPKDFRQRRPKPGGGWLWSVKGIRVIPYRLPELLAEPTRPVFVVEGEKDCDNLANIGILATCNAGGAGKWTADHATFLRGRLVFVIPDNHDTGHDHARQVVQSLQDIAESVRIVKLPGLPHKGDVSDWLDAHDSVEPDTLRERIDALADAALVIEVAEIEADASPQKAVIVCVSDVKAEPIRWLWPNRFALGKLSMIAGDPGLGKSLTTLDAAARVTRGWDWPDGSGAAPAGGVVLLNAEDDIADTIRPRLESAGGDVTRINALTAIEGHDAKGTHRRGVDLSRDLAQIEAAIKATPDCRLVVIDPVSAYLGNKDSHNNAEIRSVLAPLSDLASRHHVALLAVTHLRKGEGQAIYRAMGSLAFAAAARAVWAVTKDPGDESRRLLLPIKNNIAADASGLAFKVTAIHSDNGQPVVEWERDPVTLTTDHVLAGDTRKPGPEADALGEAIDFLTDSLAGGPRLAKDVETEGKDGHGISSRTLIRARKAAGIVAYRDAVPGPWWLRLPKDANPDDDPGLSKELGNLGTLAISSKETGNSDGGETQGCQESQVIGNGAGGHDWGLI